MAQSHDLTQLDTNSFEHLVNFLALRVLGAGTTGFGPGADGGKDGFFEGEAPYPSKVQRWSGRWYIQSKFLKPRIGEDPQKWLCRQISSEITEFKKPHTSRKLPDNWIIATNIDPSGVPETGAFDTAQRLVDEAFGKGKVNFHIWGGRKILDFLAEHPAASEYYGHFLTPGHVLKAIYNQIGDLYAEAKTVIEYLIVNQFNEQLYTKLDQAGSSADTRPKIHNLFIDLPFSVQGQSITGFITQYLNKTSAQNHRNDDPTLYSEGWRKWRNSPSRARVWILKGGPGQGKSTIGQYFAQVQRAALILDEDGPTVLPRVRATALEVKTAAEAKELWPTVPRIPVLIELKDFAKWYGDQSNESARGILTYLCKSISVKVEQQVLPGTLKRALALRSWFFAFDGLDEVPNEVKDKIAREITYFINEQITSIDADVLTLCTSRPQGYSGQFSSLDGPIADLAELPPEIALHCAEPIIRLDRSSDEGDRAMETLKTAIESSNVRELMTTPLQSHIMAVVVRDGGRPPERRWHLFDNFYQVMKKRESLKNFPDPRVAKLLREDEQLLKAIHSRLGFVLHSRAEKMEGAHSTLARAEFRTVVENTVSQFIEKDVNVTVDVLMEATTERLVFVNTPESGDTVRFDIRQLQEFFAAEFLYENVDAEALRSRVELLAGDAHWTEVMHFLVSALIENGRTTELSVVIDALTRLNEGGESGKTRMFYRRMARGSLLASRLLHEGVLEQDKRIRQKFRAILEPINGLEEEDKLLTLSQIAQPNTKSWLVDVMFDALRESSRSENIGAAIILARITDDTDPRIEELQTYLLVSPPPYLEALLKIVGEAESENGHDEGISYIRNDWFFKFMLSLLTNESWINLTVSTIASILTLLERNLNKLEKAKDALQLSIRDRQLIDVLLGKDSDTSDEREIRNYGIVSLTAHRSDWTTAVLPQRWSDINLSKPEVAPGALQMILLGLRFAARREWNDFRAMVEALKPIYRVGQRLYERSLMPYIPTHNWSVSFSETVHLLDSIDESQFQTLLRERMIDGRNFSQPVVSLQVNGGAEILAWADFVHEFSDLAVDIWFEDIGLTIDDREAMARELIKLINTRPASFTRHIVEWQKFFDAIPDVALQIRTNLVANVRKYGIPEEPMGWPTRVHPFLIDTSTEAFLLPLLCEKLVERLPLFTLEIHSSSSVFERQSLSEVFKGFGLDVETLENVVKDEGEAKEIRAAALTLLLMCWVAKKPSLEESIRFLELWSPTVISLFNQAPTKTFLKGVAFFLKQNLGDVPNRAISLLSELSEATRDDFGARFILQSVYSNWRERSSAPVQTHGVMARWLG